MHFQHMRPVVPALRTAMAMATVALFVLGCTAPLDGEAPPVSNADNAGVRAWRIVYFGWDDNELGSAIADDVAELVAADLPEDTFHCLVVRDSVLADGAIELVRRGGTTRLSVDVGKDATLFDPGAIETVRAFIDETFPAQSEIVVIAAHGRGWRGIGSTATDSATLLPAADLAVLFGPDHTDASDSIPRLAIFDVGYGASGELLTGLGAVVDHLVAAAGPRHDAGVDFERIGERLTTRNDNVPSLETAYVAFAEEFRRTLPNHTIACTAEELAGIPSVIKTFADAAPAAVSTRDRQDQVQSDLLTAAQVPGLPGDAFINADAVAHALDVTSSSIPGDLLLHLVHLDEVGVPTGHETGYGPHQETTQLSTAFADLPWAPNLTQQRGVLFEIWYRQF